MDIIGKILALIAPWKNETVAQKVGTVLTIIALLAAFVAQFFPPVPPPVPVPAVTPQDAQEGAPDVPTPSDTGAGSTGFLVGCSGAQQTIMKVAGADALNCLLSVGLKGGAVAVTAWGDGQKIDGAGLTESLVKEALPCLWRLGFVTVKTYAQPSAGYFGSASEFNVYQPDKITITVYPKSRER